MLRTLGSVLLVLALVTPAQAAKIKLIAGKPGKAGTFTFTLIASDGTTQKFEVKDIKKSDTADQKAVKIALAVEGITDWDANRNGAELTFEYKDKEVASIRDINDTTKEEETMEAVAAAFGTFQFGLKDALALGIDEDGNPSFAKVETVGATSTVLLSPGMSAKDLMDSLFKKLLSPAS